MKTKYALFWLFIYAFPYHLLAQTNAPVSGIDELRANLIDSKNNQIIVVAHRGDWRNAPENSLPALQSCIDMGVDMVEIDVQETKDGHLVLMHDYSIDRTTNGKGEVKNWTLDSLKTLFLKDGIGHITPYRIPTLEDALNICKGKILVNLDKSYEVFDKCYEIAQKTSTTNQIVIKGDKPYDMVKNEFGQYLDEMFYMPKVKAYQKGHEKILEDFISQNKTPIAIEFNFKSDTASIIQRFSELRNKDISIWVNALWPEQNGGHDDEKAFQNVRIYDWYLANHIDIIQTDRPQLLVNYLRVRGLHK